MAKRLYTSFLCLSIFLCVVVALQLVNHFAMVRHADTKCTCNPVLDEERSVRLARGDKTAANLDDHVSSMLELLANMNEVEKADYGTTLQSLYDVLQDIKETKNRFRKTRRLAEQFIPSPSEKSSNDVIQEVCPEKFLGKTLTYGYPFFRKGFATLNCTQFVPMDKIVTVVFDDVHTSRMSPAAHERVLKGIHQYYPQMNVVFITKEKKRGDVTKLKSNVKIIEVNDDTKQGEMWDTALHEVTTKYVLVARQLTEFDDDVNLQRLVRILSEQPDVTFAAGAHRSRNGHWDIGCLQAIFQNWTLTLQGGYYMSFWDCVVCEFVPGPWLARTNEILEFGFDKT